MQHRSGPGLCTVMLLSALGQPAFSQEATPAAPPPTQTQPVAPQAPPSTTASPATPSAAPQLNLTKPEGAPAESAAAPKALASGRVKDFEWRLSKVKVTGAILTVEFEAEGKCCSSEIIPLAQVSYIDDATAKKFGVLKDEGGQWMAAPLSGKDAVSLESQGGLTKTWIKFPAPPANSKTISLNMPKIGALDGIEVQR